MQVKANNLCGSSAYASKYVSIGCREEAELSGNFNVTCYPIPATDELNVVFTSDEEKSNSIRITDVLGKTLLTFNDNSVIGKNKFTLDVATISSGIYMIEVMNGDQKSIQKIMIE